MIKEWLLSQILKNKILFFKDENKKYHLINEIDFSDDVLICYYDKREGIIND